MEKKRLLWLIALVFSVVLFVQHIELPYGYVLSSLLSFGKSQVTSASSFLTRGASNDTRNSSNHTGFSGPNSTKINAAPEFINMTRLSDENDKHGLKSGSNKQSTTDSSGVSNDPEMAREKPGLGQSDLSTFVNSSSIISTPAKTRGFKGPPAKVVPISVMNAMLLQSRVSYRSLKPRWPSQVDEELLNVKTRIENARIMEKSTHIDVNVYRNFAEFLRSYELMEQTLKIYIYMEGERPIFHQPQLNGIYASEGWFMKQLQENKHFITSNPNEAHLFYLPFSSHILQETLYVPNSHSRKNLVQYLSSYVKTITETYPFWNRTDGSDHFLVACHDWAPAETSRIMKNCIRALCNADVVNGGFQFSKDVSLPETYLRNSTNPLKGIGGKPPSKRHILAFFAGKLHGYLRPVLLHYWENKDPDMKISGKLQGPKGRTTYIQYMKSSKYCISAKGYEAYTPRVVEAIFYECVPVIIADNYVPPFFETLNWESFAVFVLEKDIPNLKKMLEDIPEERYMKMQKRVRKIQKHFLWHSAPMKNDVFHMILHSMWYNRVFLSR